MFLHDYLLACEISTVRTQTLKVLVAVKLYFTIKVPSGTVVVTHSD